MNETSEQVPEVVSEQRHDTWRFAAELVKTAVIIVLLAYLIRVFLLQPFIVEGRSMVPQFENSDYLLVDKISYRLHTPHRGDIIVFKYPGDTSINYIKRIIALPGERVHLADGKVTVINAAHPLGVILNEPYITTGNLTLPTNGKSDFVVDANNYFVLGDNRGASSDSRDWGELPKVDIIGKVFVLAYPLNRLAIAPHAQYSE